MDGIDILKMVKREHPDVPVVIISGHGNIEIAVAAIKQGAYDFIEKPFKIDQLTLVIAPRDGNLAAAARERGAQAQGHRAGRDGRQLGRVQGAEIQPRQGHALERRG